MQNSKLQPDIRISTVRIDLGLIPPLLLVAFLGTEISIASNFTDFRDVCIWTFIKLASGAALYLFWYLFSYSLEALDKSNLKIPQIMLIGFSGGVFFALAEEAMGWLFQYNLGLSFPERASSYAVAAAFWFPAGSVVSRNLKRYRRLRAEVREQLLQQESVRLARTLALAEYQKQIENQIQDQLKVTSNEAARLLNSLQDSDSKRIPEYLRVISGEYFSLMGRSLSQLESKRIINIYKLKGQVSNLIKTLYESILTRPLNPLWFATMVAATILQSLQRNFDFLQVVEILILIFFSVYLVQKLQLLFIQYSGVRFLLTTFIFTAFTIILPLAFVWLIFPIQALPFRWGAFSILIIVVTISGHFAQAGLLSIEDFKLESSKDLSIIKNDEQEVNLLFLQITKDWASYIHGSITSKLESAAIEIEHALKDDDSAGVAKAIDRVNVYLKTESALKGSSQLVLFDEISEKVQAWDGLLAIEIESNIARDEVVNVSIGDVGTCIEEAILNATRHGDCTSMKIQLIDTETAFRVICSDNGIGFSGTPSGLGARIFNQASQGQWKLQRDTSRALTILTLDFPKVKI